MMHLRTICVLMVASVSIAAMTNGAYAAHSSDASANALTTSKTKVKSSKTTTTDAKQSAQSSTKSSTQSTEKSILKSTTQSNAKFSVQSNAKLSPKSSSSPQSGQSSALAGQTDIVAKVDLPMVTNITPWRDADENIPKNFLEFSALKDSLTPTDRDRLAGEIRYTSILNQPLEQK